MNELGVLLDSLENLAVFASLKRSPLMRPFLRRGGGGIRWGAVLEAAFSGGGGISKHGHPAYCFDAALSSLILYDDNPFTRAAARSKTDEEIPPALFHAAEYELSILGRIARFDFSSITPPPPPHIQEFFSGHSEDSFFAGTGDWSEKLKTFTAFLRKNGCGTFAKHRAFIWAGRELCAARNPDPVSLRELTLFEDQRAVVIANTKAFLAGKPANNILLYGDRGTGKSATVKAAANDFSRDGLRIIEVSKAHLAALPAITALIKDLPLKFIIFIDDLSFETQNDAFTHLKGLLEGGVERRPANAVVYATSNRRHLVKEKFEDRPAGGGVSSGSEADVRAFDTIEEQLSLSDRFGITVVFAAPSQEAFLAIARFIAEEHGLLNPLTASDTELAAFRDNALRWERWFNGRSPRTARQFVDWLLGGQPFPWES